MRFGLFGGPIRGPSTDAEAYRAYTEQIVEAESLGFYGVYMVEHHFTGMGQVSSSLQVLTHLSALTRTMRLGTAVVVVPWHNPLLLAEQAATLDVLSHGRLDLGLGPGYRDYEFKGFGVSAADSKDVSEEIIGILKKAWIQGTERFSYESERWNFTDIVIEPLPIQKPYPPLWRPATSMESIKKAGREGYRLLTEHLASFEEVGERLRAYREAKESAGHTFFNSDFAVTRLFGFAHSPEEREAKVARLVQALSILAGSASRVSDSGVRNPFYTAPEERRQKIEAASIIGTPEECIERLSKLKEQGVEQVLLAQPSSEDMRTFSREVLPYFS